MMCIFKKKSELTLQKIIIVLLIFFSVPVIFADDIYHSRKHQFLSYGVIPTWVGVASEWQEKTPKINLYNFNIYKGHADFVSKGLVGILPYSADYSQLKKAIKSVTSGELWFERKKLQDLVSGMESEKAKKKNLLTKIETEIVKMICLGYSNKKIMKKLRVTEQSVKSHLNRIYKKTGVSDRLQLAVDAIKRNV